MEQRKKRRLISGGNECYEEGSLNNSCDKNLRERECAENEPSTYPDDKLEEGKPKKTHTSRLFVRKKRKRINCSIDSINDENTTNSENSDSNNLFKEINWEENIEADTTDLLDEFAPRPTLNEGLTKREDMMEDEEKQFTLEEVTKVICGDPNPMEVIEQEFKPGLKIKVMDYKSSTWHEATITEVDWEEDEVLVHYINGVKSEEWVAMSSQRLSRCKIVNEKSFQPEQPKIITTPLIVLPTPKSLSPSPISQLPVPPVLVSETPVVCLTPHTQESKIDETTDKDPVQAENKAEVENEILVRKRKHRRNLLDKANLSKRVWKRGRKRPRDSSLKLDFSTSHKYKGKFSVGEKVLAKWSEHRMQKFPAVIKKMAGNGIYDVLFYDGFEKTIVEDHLFKTTEEESAKYQKANPSEADIFVEMDDDSKEARRQRKKKTFEDFIFVKDVHRKRRKGLKELGVKRHLFQSNKTDTKQTGFKGRRGHKRKKRIEFNEEEKTPDLCEEMKPDVSSPVAEPEPMKIDNEEKLDDSCLSSRTIEEPKIEEKVVALPTKEEDDRWNCDISPDACPLNIISTEKDVSFRSVIIPDKHLPPGWLKHAINISEQVWKSFLISPDGFKISNSEELRDYCRRVRKSGRPAGVDFRINSNKIPELREKQKDLVAENDYKVWISKKAQRKIRSESRKKTIDVLNSPVMSSSPSVGRVRTLLPKYRVPATSIPEPDSGCWRCVKEGCDKKFRKESLLQMHIKHYHVEFKGLLGIAPNVVDLALARSEIANSETVVPKSPYPVKRLLPKTPQLNQNPSFTEEISLKPEQEASPTTSQNPAIHQVTQKPDRSEVHLSKRLYPNFEEKKSTIKTILPLRQPSAPEPLQKTSFDSDDIESEDDVSQNFKMNRFKKHRIESSLHKDDAKVKEQLHIFSSNAKFSKRKYTPLDKLHVTTDSNDSYNTEEEKVSPNIEVTDDGVVIERLRSEEIINCTCGFREEDGLMIQCDICMCWQHGLCNGFECDSDVPEQYVCYICRHPPKFRASKKYSYALHYLTNKGKLPSFNFRNKNNWEIEQRELTLKRCYEISSSIKEIQNVEHSLRAKINIAEQPDHPKLYLWAKSWDDSGTSSGNAKEELDKDCSNKDDKITEQDSKQMLRVPEPEAQIELEECRLKLLDHVDNYIQQLDDRLTSLQTQIAALESQDPDLSSNVASDKLTNQTVQMLLRDLKTVHKISLIS